MSTRSGFILALALTVAAFAAATCMKLHGVSAGRGLLDFAFLPTASFLIIDAVVAMRRDRRYTGSRFVRLVVATVFLTIHLEFLLRR